MGALDPKRINDIFAFELECASCQAASRESSRKIRNTLIHLLLICTVATSSSHNTLCSCFHFFPRHCKGAYCFFSSFVALALEGGHWSASELL